MDYTGERERDRFTRADRQRVAEAGRLAGFWGVVCSWRALRLGNVLVVLGGVGHRRVSGMR